MKNAGKARSYGLYRHLRTSKEIIENLLNYYEEIHKTYLYDCRRVPVRCGGFLRLSYLRQLLRND